MIEDQSAQKFALEDVLVDYVGNGLTDAIWRDGGQEDGLIDAIWICDRTLSGMGLQMPFGDCLLNCNLQAERMSIRMASVFGAYLNCIRRLNLNEYENGIRVWSVSELYQEVLNNVNGSC